MDEALKALDSDEDIGGDVDSWYVQDDPEIQTNELTVDFLNLTISDHGLIPPCVPALQVCESTPQPSIVTIIGLAPCHLTPVNSVIAPHICESTPAPSIVCEPIAASATTSHVRELTRAPHIFTALQVPSANTAVAPQICDPTVPTRENTLVAP